ncbi:MAG TPA: DUF4388 domain-containing protein [candidate division Zixibacteria bacterium]|nr:DUF4388 domain-containing protein [candidate division Zixibacteria bacterium]
MDRQESTDKPNPGPLTSPGGIPLWKYLPLDLMRKYTVAPAEFDPQRRTLTVLSCDPTNNTLRQELTTHTFGLNIQLRAEHETTIQRLIDRFASESGVAVTASAPELMTLAPLSSATAIREAVVARQAEPAPAAAAESDDAEPALIITAANTLSGHLLFALKSERVKPVIVSSTEDALNCLRSQRFSHIFIHRDAARTDRILMSACAETNPCASVRVFSTERDLILNDTSDTLVDALLERTLRLNEFTSRTGAAFGQTEQIAETIATLCDKFDIPPHIRRAALAAVRLSRVAERDLNDPDAYSAGDVIALSASRLSDWGYPALVVEFVRSMSGAHRDATDTPHRHDRHLTTTSALLALAQRYWDLRGHSASELTAERRRTIARSLRAEFAGSYYEELVRALLSCAEDGDNREVEPNEAFVVYIYHPDGDEPLQWREGFERLDVTPRYFHTQEDLTAAWRSRAPHALVVTITGDGEAVRDTLFQLALHGVAVTDAPTILLLPERAALSSLWSVKHGVEDVLCGAGATEALLTKLSRIRERRAEIAQVRLAAFQDMGTHGALEDMNVMNLLEALRGNSKAVRLSVSARGHQLTAYVNQDRVLFAECDDSIGLAAFTQSVNWRQGIWSIDPVDLAEAPEPNLDQSIDSVMLEACVSFDEAAR